MLQYIRSNHFRMKKIISLTSIGLFALAAFAYADTAKVECETNPGFKTNACDACYTETYTATENTNGWTSTLTDVTVPWDHAGGDLDEIIYDKGQQKPTIKSNLVVTTKPEKNDDLWENHETLIWKPYEDHKEFVIKKGESVGLYRIKTPGAITVQGKKADDTIMFVTPLSVGSFNSETNVETEPKIRNICILGSFAIQKKAVVPAPATTPAITTPTTDTTAAPAPDTTTVTPPVSTPDTTTPAPVTTEQALDTAKQDDAPKELNAAGPEPVVAATPEQTKAKTGPEVWIFLLMAFAMASGWHAWKKQKG